MLTDRDRGGLLRSGAVAAVVVQQSASVGSLLYTQAARNEAELSQRAAAAVRQGGGRPVKTPV